MFFKKKIAFCHTFAFILIFALIIPIGFVNADAGSDDFVIVLDPGHGCTQSGTTNIYDGVEIKESCLNLKIAHYLKAELEKYLTSDGRAITVYLTHNDDLPSPMFLSTRVEKAKLLDAEVIISLHNNATVVEKMFTGSMILLTSTHYSPSGCRFSSLYEIEAGLGNAILSRLEELGIERAHSIGDATDYTGIVSESNFTYENGFLRRLSDDGSTYGNEDLTDWYGIVYHGIRLGIPSIIVEHVYLDNPNDYYNYLNTDSKLESLAVADAKGIADYYEFYRSSL